MDPKIAATHRIRDPHIVRTLLELYPRVSEGLTDEVRRNVCESHLSSYEAGWSMGGQDWDGPVIYRKIHPNGYALYAVPKLEGRQLPVWESFAEWLAHQRVTFADILAPPVQQRTQSILGGIAAVHRIKRGVRETQELFLELWADRWIFDASACARMLLQIGAAIPGTPLKGELTADEPYLAYERVVRELDIARERVESLDDWFEDLYRIAPLVKYAQFLFADLDSVDAKKYRRFLDEIATDMREVWERGILMLRNLLPHEAFYWGVACSAEAEMRQMIESLTARHSRDPTTPAYYTEDEHRRDSVELMIRGLKYGAIARVRYPRFWYERMVHALSVDEVPPMELGSFSVQRLVSIYLTYSPGLSMQMLSGANDEKWRQLLTRGSAWRFDMKSGEIF